ncbi:uncharacterized protein LOC104898461 [Beta vulgaris subsp. vulgaris]|uniref:uncharacterized protein LOC104898461 n=1 Tax=Beta vulgaris subsp. vulgaris TaxID=3555 RepID=UPI00053FE68F|nr:uncharacterized protein LOC104898461 [Beta vulgaris subsp. vulgaris]
MEKRDLVLTRGMHFFDKKRMFLKAWSPDMEVHKDDFKVVPTWVTLMLDFKYWGEKSSFNIFGGLGKPVKVDLATRNRDRLGFASILLEIHIDHEFRDQIAFINENGFEVYVDVETDSRGGGDDVFVSPSKVVKYVAPNVSEVEVANVFASLSANEAINLVDLPEKEVVNDMNVSVPISDASEELDKGVEISLSLMDRVVVWNVRGVNSLQKQHSVRNFLNTQSLGLVCLLETKVKPISDASEELDKGVEISQSLMDRVVVWNVRGINSLQKQHSVRNFLNTESLGLVCLLETKVKPRNMGALYTNVFRGIMVSDAALFMLLMMPLVESLWLDLVELPSMNNNPWMVVGDFNCVMHLDERIGSLVSSREIEAFRKCVFDCGLSDLKGVGQSFFTWSNKQQGFDRVFFKLDRVLIGGSWCDIFPDAEVRFIHEGNFDHTPIKDGNG